MKRTILILMILGLLISGCSHEVIVEEKDTVNINTPDYVGHQFNVWNNTLSGVNGRSNIFDSLNRPHISIMTSTSGATTLSIYVSEDCVNFVLCEDLSAKINAPTGSSAHIFFTAGARCYQIESSNDVRINATIIAKP